eukprot:4673685-Alexandrium_andersonii.AAC.1
MLAMWGHGPRAVAWRVLGAIPSVSWVEAFYAVRSILNSVSLQRACVPEAGGAGPGFFPVLGALLGPAQR